MRASSLFAYALLASVALQGAAGQEAAIKPAQATLVSKIVFEDGKAKDETGGLKPELEGEASFVEGPKPGTKSLKLSGKGCLKLGAPDLGELFSIAIVAKPESSSNSMVLASNSQGGFSQNGFRLFVNSFKTGDGAFIMEAGDGKTGACARSEAKAIKPGAWSSLLATANMATHEAKLYVDGKMVSGRRSSLGCPEGGAPKQLRIGAFGEGSALDCSFKGEIAEIRIYAGLLSGEEAKALAEDRLDDAPPKDATSLAEKLKRRPVLDAYGQFALEDWPGKIKSDEDLKADAAREDELLKDVAPLPAKGCDKFGGLLSAGEFKATGFFRFEKVEGRWWLVTPEGHLFFMTGADSMNFTKWGTSTPLFEKDGSPRKIFTELPDKGKYPEAYATRKGSVNFRTANVVRKYGADYRAKWADVMMKRMASWGFNAAGQWWIEPELKLPYLWDTNAWGHPRVGKDGEPDPFDPRFAESLESLAKEVDARRNDPYLVGWVFQNEEGWSKKTVDSLLTLGPKVAAKKALLDFLKERFGEEGAAKTLGCPLAQALAQPVKKHSIPEEAVEDFIELASRKYHEQVYAVFKRLDPDHLYLADAHCGNQSFRWVVGTAPCCDGVLLHNYSLDMAWISSHMPELEKMERPVMVTEFSFVCAGRGYRSYGETTTCASQRERGVSYRIFAERIAANPLFAGFSWFEFADQSPTAREIGGENHDFGLVNQCEQPYYEMIEEIRKSNLRVFELHQGKLKPFSVEEAGIYRQGATPRSESPLAIPRSGKGLEIVPRIKASIDAKDLSASIRLSWDEKGLNVLVEAADSEFTAAGRGADIWRNDAVEIWIDGTQIGISGRPGENAAEAWAWSGPQAGQELKLESSFEQGEIKGVSGSFEGWRLSARIPWEATGLSPKPGLRFKLAAIVDDADGDTYKKACFPPGYAHGSKASFQEVELSE